MNENITVEENTVRKITLVFNNNLEYLLFIKDLAGNDVGRSQIAKDLFSQEFQNILGDDKLHTIYRGFDGKK